MVAARAPQDRSRAVEHSTSREREERTGLPARCGTNRVQSLPQEAQPKGVAINTSQRERSGTGRDPDAMTIDGHAARGAAYEGAIATLGDLR